MSSTHDGHHRSFLPFGNPFKVVRTKDSYTSVKITNTLNNFEEKFAGSLSKLKSEIGSNIPSLLWLRHIMICLSNLHRDLDFLIIDLDFPVSGWETQWLDTYLDDSVKVLDICNALSSELSRYEQCQLLLRCALHVLSKADGSPSQEQIKKACSYLNEWRQDMDSRNSKLEHSAVILKALSESLHTPNFKKSSKGKVLMRAMYAVKVITIFICSVLSATLAGSSKLLIDVHVPEEFSWALALNDLHSTVHSEIRRRFTCRRSVALSETDAVSQCVDKLVSVTCNSTQNLQHALPQTGESTFLIKDEKLTGSPCFRRDLETHSKILSDELEGLSKEVRDFFHIVLKGRDALLSNLSNSSVFQVKNLQKSKSR